MSCIFCVSLVSFISGNERKIITSPITVEAGDTLRIEQGSEYLFTEYSGITVKGHLQAIGTKERPIAFVSVNDTTESGGTSFDWNGIKIIDNGSAELAYSLIANATLGITADNADRLTLIECAFMNNGQWHLSIGGVPQNVTAGQPYTHKPAAPAIIPTPAELAANVEPKATAAPTSGKPTDSRRAWRWALTGAGAAAAIGGGVFLYQAYSIRQDYFAYVPGNREFNSATPTERQQHFDKLRKDHGTAQIIGWSLLGLAAADLLYLVVFF
jgi:hypothetical protein